jgi:hypothetical protein
MPNSAATKRPRKKRGPTEDVKRVMALIGHGSVSSEARAKFTELLVGFKQRSDAELASVVESVREIFADAEETVRRGVVGHVERRAARVSRKRALSLARRSSATDCSRGESSSFRDGEKNKKMRKEGFGDKTARPFRLGPAKPTGNTML